MFGGDTMTSFPAIVVNGDLTELEKETIEAYVVRESIYILEDELEYYFSHKVKLLEMLAQGINFNKTSPAELQQQMNRTLVSPQDLEILVAKIQKRIMRELAKANCIYSFSLNADQINQGLPQFELFLSEQLRTLKLSRTVAKGIDMAWKKVSKNILPKAMTKVSNKLSVGDYLVSTLAIGPKEQEAEIITGYLRVARATLEQYQLELMNILVKQINSQLFKVQDYYKLGTEDWALIRYA
jgi:hypothetical protein